jgi:hypothetical protein
LRWSVADDAGERFVGESFFIQTIGDNPMNFTDAEYRCHGRTGANK